MQHGEKTCSDLSSLSNVSDLNTIVDAFLDSTCYHSYHDRQDYCPSDFLTCSNIVCVCVCAPLHHFHVSTAGAIDGEMSGGR